MPPEWIEHSTSPLPRVRSTTELRRQEPVAALLASLRGALQAGHPRRLDLQAAQFVTTALWSPGKSVKENGCR